MKKLLINIVFLLVSIITVQSQNYIGLHKFDIQKQMEENMSNFTLDNSTKNKTYKYLKYVDRINEETLLYFLSSNDYCTSSRLISDYSNLNSRTKQLDKEYEKIDKTTWTYKVGSKEYIVKLKKEEWFFLIVTKKKE